MSVLALFVQVMHHGTPDKHSGSKNSLHKPFKIKANFTLKWIKQSLTGQNDSAELGTMGSLGGDSDVVHLALCPL